MSQDPTALEPTMEVDSFGPVTESGAKGLALRIQTVLMTEKGTYPNNYSLGVAMQNYNFEMLDDQTLSEMQAEISDQVTRWVAGGSYIRRVIVERMALHDPSMQNAVLVAFELGDAVEDARFIAIAIQKDQSTSRLSSEVVIQ